MPAFLVQLILGILQIVVPALFNASKPTMEDSQRQPERKERLRNKLRNSGWITFLIVCVWLSGCVRTIYVPAGEPVRLRETLDSVKVWVMDNEGNPVASEMTIPEGWYMLDDPGE